MLNIKNTNANVSNMGLLPKYKYKNLLYTVVFHPIWDE